MRKLPLASAASVNSADLIRSFLIQTNLRDWALREQQGKRALARAHHGPVPHDDDDRVGLGVISNRKRDFTRF